MLTYGTLAMLLIEYFRSHRGDRIALRLLPIGAVAGDAPEGVALLKVLGGVDVDTNARLARGAALGKFALLAVAHAYLVSAVVRRRS